MTGLLGTNVDRTISLTFMLGAMLAAVAGVLVTVYYGVVDFYIGFVVGIKVRFTAAVPGGIGSFSGAMLAAVLIWSIEAFWSAYLAPEYSDVATAILILVLMFRPSGLLGRPEVEKV